MSDWKLGCSVYWPVFSSDWQWIVLCIGSLDSGSLNHLHIVPSSPSLWEEEIQDKWLIIRLFIKAKPHTNIMLRWAGSLWPTPVLTQLEGAIVWELLQNYKMLILCSGFPWLQLESTIIYFLYTFIPISFSSTQVIFFLLALQPAF